MSGTAALASAIAAASQTGGTQMRIGTVTAFDSVAGTLTVNVGGTAMAGLFYNPSYLPLLGDIVVVLNSGPIWYVLGSTVNALARTLPVAAAVGTSESTSSTGFTDLATVGPVVTVTIGASGKALVFISALLPLLTSVTPQMAFAMSGANTAAANGVQCLEGNVTGVGGPPTPSGTLNATRVVTLLNLNQGSTTFTAKYAVASGTGFFADRELAVLPF